MGSIGPWLTAILAPARILHLTTTHLMGPAARTPEAATPPALNYYYYYYYSYVRLLTDTPVLYIHTSVFSLSA